MSAEEAGARGLQPLARVVATATAGVDPALMGTGTGTIANLYTYILAIPSEIGKVAFILSATYMVSRSHFDQGGAGIPDQVADLKATSGF